MRRVIGHGVEQMLVDDLVIVVGRVSHRAHEAVDMWEQLPQQAYLTVVAVLFDHPRKNTDSVALLLIPIGI